MLGAIVCFPNSDVINFEFILISLIAQFSTSPKSQEKKLTSWVRKELFRWNKITYLIIFKGRFPLHLNPMLNGFTNKSTFKGKRKILMTHIKTLISLLYFVIKCLSKICNRNLVYWWLISFSFLINLHHSNFIC